MATAVSRRQFLRGDRLGRRVPIRPPWSLSEPEFIAACNRCGDCIGACKARLIVCGSGGFPVVDFFLGECSFCADCAKACRSGALCYDAVAQAWDLRAVVGHGCIALQGVVCGSCADACGPAAIRLAPALGGVARPSLAGERCNGCGACFGVCPSNAIEMKPALAPAPV